MNKKYRTMYCGDVTESDIDKKIRVAGWIENIRDHGGVLFLDLRDEHGVLQVVSNDDSIFSGLTRESSITVSGKIRARSEEDYNNNISTGTVELLVDDLKVLGEAMHELPFEIRTSTSVNEETRLKYRYLDLRNDKVHSNIVLRSKILKFITA